MADHDAPIEVVRGFYAAFASGDLDALFERCAPDITIDQDPALPWGGHRVGHDGLATFGVTLAEHIDSHVTIEGLFQAGDDVVQHGRTAGTVRATGSPFDVAECHVWTVRDGFATQARFYIDTEAMLAALRA